MVDFLLRYKRVNKRFSRYKVSSIYWICPSPMLYYADKVLKTDGAIMIQVLIILLIIMVLKCCRGKKSLW